MVDDRDAKHEMTSWESDERYIARGRAMAAKYNPDWDDELEEMNRGKVGHPFKYSDSMMAFVAICRVMLGIGYRECEGYLVASWGKDRAPDYSSIWKGIGKTMPKLERNGMFDCVLGRTIRLVPDSTGVKLGNRGEWLSVKWKVARGFFKMHILVDLDTGRILAFSLTDVKGGDAAQLPDLLCRALGGYVGRGVSLPEPIAEMVSNAASAGKAGRQIDHKQTLMDHWLYENEGGTAAGEDAPPAEVGVDAEDVDGTIDAEFARLGRELEELGVKIELRADGGYDSRVTFAFLAALGIIPVIRVRINSGARAKGKNRARAKAVLEQLGGRGRCTGRELNRMTNEERGACQKEWKKDTRYGLRWMVEIIISAFKRVFGESVRALTPRTAFIEVATKVAAYNRNLDIGDEAIREETNRRAQAYGAVAA